MATLKPPKLSAAVASFADFLQQARTTVGDVKYRFPLGCIDMIPYLGEQSTSQPQPGF